MASKLKVGVVGTGLIAQVMHLHFLRELKDSFEIFALCDLSLDVAQLCADEYGVGVIHSDWHELLNEPIDAVLVLTSGSHAPIAIEAARRGIHVFVEKPMCFSVEEGKAMIAEASAAGVTLMVGYPKRYDPAFLRFQEEASELPNPKLLRVTTFEAPFKPYLRHYPMTPPGVISPETLSLLKADNQERLEAAIGTSDEFYVNQYHWVLIDSMIHEINAIRGVLGEPDRLDYVDIRRGSLTALLSFGETAVALNWMDLPGMTNYLMEFAIYDDNRRVTLSLPSPNLRNAPAKLVVEGGDFDDVASWRREEITSYESSFKLEMIAFRDAIISGAAPLTDGADGVRDIALCQSIIWCAQRRAPIDQPSKVS